MKKTTGLVLIGLLMLLGVSTVAAAPWVYPADEASPSTTEYWQRVYLLEAMLSTLCCGITITIKTSWMACLLSQLNLVM